MSVIARHHAEWLSLIEVSGPFLTLPVLERVFPQGLDAAVPEQVARLRDARDEWLEGQERTGSDIDSIHGAWISFILREILGFGSEELKLGEHIPVGLHAELKEHHETVSPNFAVVNPAGRANAGQARLLVMTWPRDQELDGTVEGSSWAASPSERMTVLCKTAGVRLGLVTDGHRWMLVDAPQEGTAGYASWYSNLWLEERLTLRAFQSLLGVRRFFAVAETDTLEQMLHESSAYQEEVTDQLGYQVRRAVEVLVQALDRADLDRGRMLLEGVTPERLYEAGLTVMMRLVFLFCAEERGLLLFGDSIYDDFYAVSTLRGLLREEADRVGLEVLERRQDAWARLLASFRAVYGGLEHDSLRMPALGGSLFDPDRFPFLEGRARGTLWVETPAVPLPIDNRTVLYLLEALQLLQMKGSAGSKEARRLSFRALDVEQIGYVYEGLLDHIAVRVSGPTLGLIGTKDKEPEVLLSDLERERAKGQDALVVFLKEQTGRSVAALRKGLKAEVEDDIKEHLLVACGNDLKLLEQVLPYHAQIREDVWGYPQVYRTGSFMVTGGPERRETGTHYTPQSLTEKIVTTTLEPLAYDGPADGKPKEEWKLRQPAELLDLKICDPAMGSGAFLVQACRWLAERLVEAWNAAEKVGQSVSVAGDVLETSKGRELLPKDQNERITIARRLIAERCLYGVDINHLAVELAKLSIWLVTLARDRPFGFLDHNLRCGDSLLGVYRLDQLTALSMTPDGKGQQRLFGKNIEQAVIEAIGLRQQLRKMPILDIYDVEAMERLDADARRRLEVSERIADAFVGTVFSAAGNKSALETGLNSLAIAAGHVIDREKNALKSLVSRAHAALSLDLPSGKTSRQPFHWALEFPEVMANEGFDGVIGNPPYLWGMRISTFLGQAYLKYLEILAGCKLGTADFCVHFLHRSINCTNAKACIGLVLVDTISQGDTREVGLARILNSKVRIIDAQSSRSWPGGAGVKISPLVIKKGLWSGDIRLDTKEVRFINSRLLPEFEEITPYSLSTNVSMSFVGHYLMGQGFVLTENESQDLIEKEPLAREVIFDYVRGEDINQVPNQKGSLKAINFGVRLLAECESKYPIALDRIRKLVKPERELKRVATLRAKWWQYARPRPALNKVLSKHKIVLVQPFTSKYLTPTFVATNCVFAHPIVVIGSDDYAIYGVLQSDLHDAWVRKYASKMGDRIRYASSDCFENFPFPENLEVVRSIAETHYLHRQKIMIANNQGVTTIFNRFHDRDEMAADIQKLRELHIKLNTIVLTAYGWEDIVVSYEYRNTDLGVRFILSDETRREILYRLLQENHVRHDREIGKGSANNRASTQLSHNNQNFPSFFCDAIDDQVSMPLDYLLAAEQTPLASEISIDQREAYILVNDEILCWLRANYGWHGKEEIVAGSRIEPSQWPQAIRILLEKELIEKKGDRRNTRYRIKG